MRRVMRAAAIAKASPGRLPSTPHLGELFEYPTQNSRARRPERSLAVSGVCDCALAANGAAARRRMARRFMTTGRTTPNQVGGGSPRCDMHGGIRGGRDVG